MSQLVPKFFSKMQNTGERRCSHTAAALDDASNSCLSSQLCEAPLIEDEFLQFFSGLKRLVLVEPRLA